MQKLYTVFYTSFYCISQDHAFPTLWSTVIGPIFSKNVVSSCDLVSKRPTMPVLFTAMLYPSSLMKSSFVLGEMNIQSVVITKLYEKLETFSGFACESNCRYIPYKVDEVLVDGREEMKC